LDTCIVIGGIRDESLEGEHNQWDCTYFIVINIHGIQSTYRNIVSIHEQKFLRICLSDSSVSRSSMDEAMDRTGRTLKIIE
jgi:hypothetical protein